MKLKFDFKKNFLVIVPPLLVGSIILVFSFFYLQGLPILFSSITVISIMIMVLPFIFTYYEKYRKIKEIEEMFPVFLRDFVESVRGGMTIPQAFKSVSGNDYKSLTYFVKKMYAQLDWGIPVEKVLTKFAKESQSKLVSRIISSVIESHRFGGNLSDTFEALSNTSIEVDRLRAERRLYLHSQMLTGYIIFFVFLAVLIGLDRFLVPSLANVSPAGLTLEGQATISQSALILEFKTIFRNLILVQGLFAGLAVGKMAEGAMISGLKHSFFMMAAGVIIFTGGSLLG